MASLHQVIVALRREIDVALEENAVPGGTVLLEPERVVLSLEVSVREQRAPDGRVEFSFEVLEAGQKEQTHRLTFEFKSIARPPADAGNQPASATPKLATAREKAFSLDAADASKVIESLSSVFGPPGFDSSARATVFREVFAALSEPQIAALIASFCSGTVPDDDVMLSQARHRINGVFRSGPLRSVERGSEVSAEVLNRYALEPIVRLVQENWKGQNDWLNEEAAPRPSKHERGRN